MVGKFRPRVNGWGGEVVGWNWWFMELCDEIDEGEMCVVGWLVEKNMVEYILGMNSVKISKLGMKV